MMRNTVCKIEKPMAAEEFDERFSVGRGRSECWAVLVDVDRVASWVTAVGAVTEHANLSHYSAVLEDRMGPFKLRADLDIKVTDLSEAESITVRADGEDRQVGSRITVDATLGLVPDGEGTTVTIAGRYEVTGRVATMGASTIRSKANKMLQEFTDAAKRDLA